MKERLNIDGNNKVMRNKKIIIGIISSLLILCAIGLARTYFDGNRVNKKMIGKWKVVDCGAVDANNKSETMFVKLYATLLPKESVIEIKQDAIIIHGQAAKFRIIDEKIVITNNNNSETYIDAYFSDKGNLVFKIGNFAAVMEKLDNNEKK